MNADGDVGGPERDASRYQAVIIGLDAEGDRLRGGGEENHQKMRKHKEKKIKR